MLKTVLPWILYFVAAEVVLTLLQFALRKHRLKPAVRICVILLKAFAAVVIAYLVMAGPVFLRPVHFPLTAIYAVLLPDAAADLVVTVYCLIRKKERSFVGEKLLSLVLGVAFFIYGTVNMQIVSPNYHTFSSTKLTQEHKLVFVSDMHVGGSQSLEVTRRTIEGIRSEQPDFVILGGDITDDYTTREELEETYRLFGALGVPVYYIDGNHEVVQHAEYVRGGLNYTLQDLMDILDRNGITILRDTYVDISPDLILLGREDAAMKDPLPDPVKPNPEPEKFLLVADHQPTRMKESQALGADLQLSGHSHAGQLFPLNLVYIPFTPVQGEYKYEGTILFVSPGASGWGFPFRTTSRCRYEVITLKPER